MHRNLVMATVVMVSLAATKLAVADTKTASSTSTDAVARGKALVTHGMCHDCHTPKIFTAEGKMEFDWSRTLAGHPAGSKLPVVDKKALTPGYWVMTSPDLTAWIGPWGMSYAINLTPDDQTGIGLWTDAIFIKAMRTGKHMGEGRPILPPMPWNFVGDMSDDELKSIFAYMESLPPIKNLVPQPVAPPDVK